MEYPVLPTSLIPCIVPPPPSKETASPLMDEKLYTSVESTEESDDVVVPIIPDTLMNTLSVKQLRERCKELGLNTDGKKNELAERISEYMNK